MIDLDQNQTFIIRNEKQIDFEADQPEYTGAEFRVAFDKCLSTKSDVKIGYWLLQYVG